MTRELPHPGLPYVLDAGQARLTIDPSVGGRIRSLRLGDCEVLSGADADRDNWGSTFWTSPQSDWGWPPPPEVDRAPYAVDARGHTVTLTGPPSPTLGVRVTKRFSADASRQAFVLDYGIVNVGDTPKTLAPWEVTRVRSRGLTFFPTRGPASGSLPLDDDGKATWFLHHPDALPSAGHKAFADTSGGWLAHASDGVLFVKTIDEVPSDARAPGQSEIEIYANDRYVELEVQGRYAAIAPRASLSWTVTWHVRRIPSDVAVQPREAGLVALAADVARRQPL